MSLFCPSQPHDPTAGYDPKATKRARRRRSRRQPRLITARFHIGELCDTRGAASFRVSKRKVFRTANDDGREASFPASRIVQQPIQRLHDRRSPRISDDRAGSAEGSTVWDSIRLLTSKGYCVGLWSPRLAGCVRQRLTKKRHVVASIPWRASQ
jgi:hypothetical protein